MRSIEEQIQEVLYQFDESGVAVNNANRFTASLDNAELALAVSPFEGDWEWRLAPVLAESKNATTEGNRLTVERSESLTEWFVNEPRGIEQGFTLTEPPADGCIEMKLTTNLSPTLTGGGDAQEIRFDDPETGETKLRYAELFVTDANGDRVPAEISVARHSNVESNAGLDFGKSSYEIALVLDGSAARYPLTVDPIVTTLAADLVDAEFQGEQEFGRSAAISGDVMVVSSPEGGHDPKVTVFERGMDGVWGETAALRPTPHNARFGGVPSSLAIHNDRIVVGASGNLGGEIPATYVFERNDTGGGEPWMQTARLLPETLGVQFGRSVAIWEDTIAVIDPIESRSSVHVFEFAGGSWQQAAEFTDLGTSVGLAISAGRIVVEKRALGAQVIERDPTAPQGWRLADRLLPNSNEEVNLFAANLDADGDLVVAAPNSFVSGSDHLPLAVFQNTDGNGAWERTIVPISGSLIYDVRVSGHRIAVAHNNMHGNRVVAVLEKDAPVAGEWGTVATFSYEDGIGFSAVGDLDLSGDRLLVTWVNSGRGRAVVYELRNAHWAPVATPQPDAPQAGEAFGKVLAADRDVLVVGSPKRRDNLRGGGDVGAAYVFHRATEEQDHTWRLAQELPLPAGVITGDRFGASVATADGEWIAVGAPGSDGAGNTDLGSAFVYRRDADGTWSLADTLVPSEASAGQHFGEAIALGANTLHLLVGAPGHGGGSGRTYAFQRSQTDPLDWQETQIINAVSGTSGTGKALAVHGSSAMIGAPDTDGGNGLVHVVKISDHWRTVTSFRGTRGGNFGARVAAAGHRLGLIAEPGSGRVYACDLHAPGNTVPLLPPADEPSDGYGAAIAVVDEFAYVGAPGAASVFVFSRNPSSPGAWVHRDTLKPGTPGANGEFGSALVASGRNLAIGMPSAGTGGEVEVQRMAVRQWSATRGGDSLPAINRPLDAMALDGDTLVVGDPEASRPVNGVGLVTGLAFTFERNLGVDGWSIDQRLEPTVLGDGLGSGVDISGEHIVVSAPGGNAVYFFRRKRSLDPAWELDKRITVANDVQLTGKVAISGRHAVVALDIGSDLVQTFREIEGAGWQSEARLGTPVSLFRSPMDVAIDGDRLAFIQNRTPNDRCFVFEFTGDRTWTEVASITLSSSAVLSVAVAGEVIAVGTPGDRLTARDAEGSVKLFDRLGNPLDTLIGHPLPQADGSSAPPEGFGRAISMEDGYLVVGQHGAASVFERYGNRWGRVATFTGTETSFGRHVALSGTTFAVAAPSEPSGNIFGSVRVFEIDPERDAFDEWRRGYFTDDIVNNPALETLVWSPNADPDGDGVSNLREAFHGMDPTVPDAARAQLQLTTGQTMKLHWHRGLQTAGADAEIEWSTDLRMWFGMHEAGAPAFTTRIVGEEIGAFRMESEVNAGSLTKCFFRFRYRR